VREAPSLKKLCELGRLWLALDWANARRLGVVRRPEEDGAIPSVWGNDESGSFGITALPRGTWSDQANRRTTNLRTDQGNG